MDPNETLRMIDEFIANRKTGEEVDDWCLNLHDWIMSGGFKPDFDKYRAGASYFRCRWQSLIRAERRAEKS